MAGIGFGGSGNVVSYNEVYNSPHTAITGSGNNWLFEGNYVHDVCRGTTDAGAFYVGRTWSSLGNTLKNNTFNRSAPVEKLTQYASTVGIYLDDMDSGWDLLDNYVGGSPLCIELGGGRVNMVRGNRFENCDTAVHLDRRNVITDTNPINGSFCFGTTPSEGSLGGIVSIYHIDKPDSVWGRAYGVGSPRPFNWTFATDGPAFVNVSNNAFRSCGKFTDAPADLAGYRGLTSERAILAALQVRFQWKNPEFRTKNPTSLIKNPDFLLKNVDLCKNTE